MKIYIHVIRNYMVLLVQSVNEFPNLEVDVIDGIRQLAIERIGQSCRQAIALSEGQGCLRIIPPSAAAIPGSRGRKKKYQSRASAV